MSTTEGQHFICPLKMEYISYYQGTLTFKGIFLPEKRVLQDMICCPSAVNKCSFKRTYYSIFGKECLLCGNIICCPFRMYCLAPYTVPLGLKWNVTQNGMSHKMKFHSKWNVTHNWMSLKIKCYSKWKVTTNSMVLKIKLHSKLDVIKNGVSLKIKCHPKWNVNQK